MMNRLILTAVCALLIGTASTTTMAAECVGGTLITANSASHDDVDCGENNKFCNGHTFCKSDNKMNWWSAFTWCKSNGRNLASFAMACPEKPTSINNVKGACPNLQGVSSGVVWLNLFSHSEFAFRVTVSSGAVYTLNIAKDLTAALCE